MSFRGKEAVFVKLSKYPPPRTVYRDSETSSITVHDNFKPSFRAKGAEGEIF